MRDGHTLLVMFSKPHVEKDWELADASLFLVQVCRHLYQCLYL